MTDDGWKYVLRRDGREALIHLASDPDERHDLRDDPSRGDILADLRRRLRDWW